MAVCDLGPKQAELAWSATFQPDGLPANEAQEMLEGAFELSTAGPCSSSSLPACYDGLKGAPLPAFDTPLRLFVAKSPMSRSIFDTFPDGCIIATLIGAYKKCASLLHRMSAHAGSC